MFRKRDIVCRGVLTICLLLRLFSGDVAAGHGGAVTGEMGVDEKLGTVISGDITFTDEQGRIVTMSDVINRPTIISLVYLSCNHTCPLLLSGVAEVLGGLDLNPLKEYGAITLSFDERDTAETARDRKKNYIKAVGRSFPEEAWKFLTGDRDSIQKFTREVGFQFRREGEGFSHPVVLIVSSPDRKIVRYLYGTTFLPFDLSMALAEASRGQVGSPVRKALLYCYQYDAQGKRYVFNTLKVVGTVIMATIFSFFIYLVLSGKKARQRGQ